MVLLFAQKRKKSDIGVKIKVCEKPKTMFKSIGLISMKFYLLFDDTGSISSEFFLSFACPFY